MVRRGLVALVLAYAVTAGGAAGQESDVREAVAGTLAAWTNGDFAEFAAFYSSDARGFFLDGGLLVEGGINAEALQVGYDAGIRADFDVRDIDVRVVGGVAVSVGYLEGSLTLPGGAVRSGTWRYTDTRIREAGIWKVIQFHISDLTVPGR